MKKILQSRKNRVIALVLAIALMAGSLVIGLAATLAETKWQYRLQQPSTTLYVLPSGSSFSLAAGGVSSARLVDESLGHFEKIGTSYVLTTDGTKTAGIAQIVRVNNSGWFMLDLNLQVADASKITGYDLPNEGNGFVSKASSTVPVNLGITYYKSAAAVIPNNQPWAPNESAISDYDGSAGVQAALANQVEWTSLDPDILFVEADKRTVYAKAEGITMLLGKFVDRWGVEQHIHFVFGVGTAPGQSNNDLSKLLDAIKKGQTILDLEAPNPYKEDGLGVLQAAVEAAKALLDSGNLDKGAIKGATDAIISAIDGLEQANTGGETIITVPGDGKYKRPSGPPHIYEVLDPDTGDSQVPPAYIYDPDGSLEQVPPVLGDDTRPAYRDGYIYYVEEDPEGSNIFFAVDPDTGALDEANPKWGGPDKQPGGGDDSAASKDGTAWYAEDPAGSNLWKPVRTTATGADQGTLDPEMASWKGGGTDGKPGGTDDLFPITVVDGKTVAGPFGTGDDTYYVGAGDDGRFDTAGWNNTGIPQNDVVHPSDVKYFWDGEHLIPDNGAGKPRPPVVSGDGVNGNTVTITLNQGYDAPYNHPISIDGNPAPSVSKVAGGNASINYSNGNIVVTKGLTQGSYSAQFTISNASKSITLTVNVRIVQNGGGGKDEPVGVNGRVLDTAKTGDSSEWIEIAQQVVGGKPYSLILRKASIGEGYFGTENKYNGSTAQKAVNAWFLNDSTAGTSLKWGANLRNFTVTSDVMTKIGTFPASSSGWDGYGSCDGFSKPTGTKDNGLPVAAGGKGTLNIAFLLSFGEATRFCSKRWTLSGPQVSNPNAVENWTYLNTAENWWLRTPSGTNDACVVSNLGYATNRDELNYNFDLRPALWVDSAIFSN
ncbi:MAG: FIVAR domain-containing protein [Oscillospiraceae bacterium]|jgi:hypothetical protein|nr:FIVAR domain-containing protein [Oscillospiraceae bacterium]